MLSSVRRIRDRLLQDAQVRLASLTAVCLLTEAVIAKNVLEVRLDFFAQMAPFWVYLFATLGGAVEPQSERGIAATILAVTVAVLVLYAL